jgi:hypothetical protein
MFKFTIRDTILATTVIALALAWWLDHRQTRARVTALEWDSVKWKFRAEYLKDHICGMKVDGKWLYPWRINFDPDTEKVETGIKNRGGEWAHPAGTKIEWQADWAAVR